MGGSSPGNLKTERTHSVSPSSHKKKYILLLTLKVFGKRRQKAKLPQRGLPLKLPSVSAEGGNKYLSR